MFDKSNIEIYQVSKLATRQFQVSQYLCQVDIIKCFDGFYFNDDFILDQQINPITAIQFYLFVNDWQCFLRFYLQPSLDEFELQTCFISGL